MLQRYNIHKAKMLHRLNRLAKIKKIFLSRKNFFKMEQNGTK